MSLNMAIQKGDWRKVNELIKNLEVVDPAVIHEPIGKHIIEGLIFHMTKPKFTQKSIELYRNKENSDKKSTKTYYRMVFVRSTILGTVFAVIYNLENIKIFKDSDFEVLKSYKFIKPILLDKWLNEIKIFEVKIPSVRCDCVEISTSLTKYEIQENGYYVLRLDRMILEIIEMKLVNTCGGRMCGGFFGTRCICDKKSTEINVKGFSIDVYFSNIGKDLEKLKIKTYYCKAEAFNLTEKELLKTTSSSEEILDEIVEYLDGIETTIIVWVKVGSKKNEPLSEVNYSGHIIEIKEAIRFMRRAKRPKIGENPNQLAPAQEETPEQ